jgi:hypothetical protein
MLVRGETLNPNGRNPTGVKLGLENNRRYTAVIRVRRNAVGVWLDSNQIVNFPTDGKNLAILPNFGVSNPRALGVGVMAGCRTDFHALWAKEISGKGKFAASQPAGG